MITLRGGVSHCMRDESFGGVSQCMRDDSFGGLSGCATNRRNLCSFPWCRPMTCAVHFGLIQLSFGTGQHINLRVVA
jgi:hypothetical protein